MLKPIIGANIKRLRKKKRHEDPNHRKFNKPYSIEDLALEASVTQLGKIERGQWNPTLRTLRMIAKALGVNLYDLFDEGNGQHTIIDAFIYKRIKPISKLLVYDPVLLLSLVEGGILEKYTVEDIENNVDPDQIDPNASDD